MTHPIRDALNLEPNASENEMHFCLFPEHSTGARPAPRRRSPVPSRCALCTLSFPASPHLCISDPLEDFERVCLGILSPLLAAHVWQRDPFALWPSTHRASPLGRDPARAASLPPHLWGSLNFSENVDDEWFVVFLLKTLSARLPHLAIHVWDNDGQFLLIEAADALPRWITPEIADNRVFLFRDELHVIPLVRLTLQRREISRYALRAAGRPPRENRRYPDTARPRYRDTGI